MFWLVHCWIVWQTSSNKNVRETYSVFYLAWEDKFQPGQKIWSRQNSPPNFVWQFNNLKKTFVPDSLWSNIVSWEILGWRDRNRQTSIAILIIYNTYLWINEFGIYPPKIFSLGQHWRWSYRQKKFHRLIALRVYSTLHPEVNGQLFKPRTKWIIITHIATHPRKRPKFRAGSKVEINCDTNKPLHYSPSRLKTTYVSKWIWVHTYVWTWRHTAATWRLAYDPRAMSII